MVKVSICIPAYRQPEALKRCLASILRQTYRRFEVVISDDTPDDSVRNAVESFGAEGVIRYYHNKPPKGTPENWNEAMRKAEGDYIIVMHHDDWFYADNALEELIHSAESGEADFIFAQSFNIASDGRVLSKNDPDRRKLRVLNGDVRALFYHNWVGAPSAVLFRNRGVFFDTRLKWLVDVEFYMRYLGRSRIVYNPRAVVGIGIGPFQATGSSYGNADVEISENLLVYAGLKRPLEYFVADFLHFFRLFKRLEPGREVLLKYRPSPRVRFYFLVSGWLIGVKKIVKKLAGKKDNKETVRS